jgi:sigma-E factor negative regulatory protein RseA
METDVTRNIEEQLSAFLDGELPEAELELLVRRLERDPALRSTLARYSAIGSILRKDHIVEASAGFRTRVMRAISDDGMEPERSMQEQNVAATGKWRMGSMLAAAVAVFTVTGLYQLNLSDSVLPTNPEIAAIADESLPAVNSRAASGIRDNAVKSQRMTSYLVSHGEFSRSLQGAMVDSRIFVQQARFEE